MQLTSVESFIRPPQPRIQPARPHVNPLITLKPLGPLLDVHEPCSSGTSAHQPRRRDKGVSRVGPETGVSWGVLNVWGGAVVLNMFVPEDNNRSPRTRQDPRLSRASSAGEEVV